MHLPESRIIEITCTDKQPVTAERLLKRHGLSRRLIILLKKTEGGITCAGRQIRTIDSLSEGDILRLTIPAEKKAAPVSVRLTVPKAYEDEDLIVYNKPAGVPAHRSHGHYDDTLEYAFTAEYGIPFRGVNRLDMNTSGLCIAAKNKLSADIGQWDKTYFAICEGDIESEMTIDAPIGRADGSAILRCVRADGKPSVTHITPIKRMGSLTLLEIHPMTGRTHQIRVHMAHIGHPLVGDDLYGSGKELISRHALHCGRICFIHPVTGERHEISSEMPDDMKQLAGL